MERERESDGRVFNQRESNQVGWEGASKSLFFFIYIFIFSFHFHLLFFFRVLLFLSFSPPPSYSPGVERQEGEREREKLLLIRTFVASAGGRSLTEKMGGATISFFFVFVQDSTQHSIFFFPSNRISNMKSPMMILDRESRVLTD